MEPPCWGCLRFSVFWPVAVSNRTTPRAPLISQSILLPSCDALPRPPPQSSQTLSGSPPLVDKAYTARFSKFPKTTLDPSPDICKEVRDILLDNRLSWPLSGSFSQMSVPLPLEREKASFLPSFDMDGPMSRAAPSVSRPMSPSTLPELASIGRPQTLVF